MADEGYFRGEVALPQLIPLKAIACGGANFGSADANEGCFCGDDGFFVIKKNDAHPTLPHSEWFCSSLAMGCDVPQVPFSVIEHMDGNHWFGSLWQNGKVADWWTLAEQGKIDFSALADDISKIYAFDLFINNVDRHMNNYMVVPAKGGHTIRSFDYSRAWLCQPFPPVEIMDDDAATISCKDWFKNNFENYPKSEAMCLVIDRIEGMKLDTIKGIIAGHPHNWLTNHQSETIIDWWKSGMAAQRASSIRKGIADGSLL